MPRFVLRRTDDAASPSVSALARRVTELGGRVLASTSTMVQIDASAQVARKLRDEAPGVICAPEVQHRKPGPPRVKARKPAG